jgi:hypothetical protein
MDNLAAERVLLKRVALLHQKGKLSSWILNICWVSAYRQLMNRIANIGAA